MKRTPSLIRKMHLVDMLLEECQNEGVVVEEPIEQEIKQWDEQEIREYFTSHGKKRPLTHTPQTKAAFEAPSKAEWEKWFPGLLRSGTMMDRPKGIVLCFHNAGNAEDMYTSEGTGHRRVHSPLLEWCRQRNFLCLAAQLPGRGNRRTEQIITQAQEAAEEIFRACANRLMETSYTVIAHSMGCWIAYEFLLLARRRHAPMPRIVFFSGMPSPDLEFEKRPWRQQHLLNQDQFKEECRAWDINSVVFDSEMWKQYEPLLRSDFTVFDTYRWTSLTSEEIAFDFPISTFWGSHDRRVVQHMVQGWQKFTRKEFECQEIDGNHLWPLDKEAKIEWLKQIVQKLDSIYLP